MFTNFQDDMQSGISAVKVIADAACWLHVCGAVHPLLLYSHCSGTMSHPLHDHSLAIQAVSHYGLLSCASGVYCCRSLMEVGMLILML